MIVTTGTGSTGWALSISRQLRSPPALPAPTDDRLELHWGRRVEIAQAGTRLCLVRG